MSSCVYIKLCLCNIMVTVSSSRFALLYVEHISCLPTFDNALFYVDREPALWN